MYAVTEDNDRDPDRDDTVPLGVKKINDMGVFTVTTIFSIWAYLWLYIVLMDQVVSPTEAWLTLVFFVLLLVISYGADRYKAKGQKTDDLSVEQADESAPPVTNYTHVEIMRELINEKNGETAKSEEQIQRRKEMKAFLVKALGTDQIDRINNEDLKKACDQESAIGRIKYRREVGKILSGKKKEIAKGEILKQEHAHAENIDDREKNPHFGFYCLHYSVSEASGTIKIKILNKTGKKGSVRVRTIDAEAIAGDDYEAIDELLKFNEGEKEKYVSIKINDDDNWEPDEDFFVQLYDPASNIELTGIDSRTRVTIIDDDKPGQICFAETKQIKVLGNAEECIIRILRKNGADGVVTVDYETFDLDTSAHTATAGIDYQAQKGTLKFGPSIVEQEIVVRILHREDVEERDESFGIRLQNVTPAGAKLSKKSFQIINIITDKEGKKKSEALQQLLEKIEQEEEQTWGSQFITACKLHPIKNEDGEIEDISFMEGFLHFVCIGWKLLFAFIPPPHFHGGWSCFYMALVFIGVVTFVVGEFANLFGCVLGIPPAVTAITFVALGTSLPDTFASMVAAAQEKYADSAVGNVTGSNSVNVFLGLGLPWVIATMWELSTSDESKGYKTSIPGGYFVPSATLGFSVIVFIVVAIGGLAILLIRRKVVGGELGGSLQGRMLSAGLLTLLWFLYILFSIFQSFNIAGIGDQGWGIDLTVKNPNPKCLKDTSSSSPAPAATGN